jgi:uncharacterized protein YgbK (DUF1537 family)
MIGVIADDLTGAAELSGVGLRYGLQSEVVAAGLESRLQASPRDGPAEAGTPNGPDLLCVDTDSRTCPAAEASRRAAEAAGKLTASRAEWIYKKVDSVLRGHILVELEALMNQRGLKRALLVPANPSLGRVVRNGHYFVWGKPIHETDFRFDPEFPRRTSSVRKLLGTPGSQAIQVCGTRDRSPLAGIIIGEAESTDDLRHWASQSPGGTLLAGAAEFFATVLEASGYHVAPSVGHRPHVPVGKPELFVCGSASEACQGFLAESKRRGVPVFGLPEEFARGDEFTLEQRERLAERVADTIGRSPRVILEIGLQPVSDPRVARQLANQLAELARAVLLRARLENVYAEGGATGASLLRSMSWRRLQAVRELAPGVVTFQVEGDLSCLLTLKPGSYLWPKEVGP